MPLKESRLDEDDAYIFFWRGGVVVLQELNELISGSNPRKKVDQHNICMKMKKNKKVIIKNSAMS